MGFFEMKKFMYMIGAAVASPFALLAETGGTTGSDIASHITEAQAGELFTAAQGTLTGIIDKAWPVLGVLLVTGLTIWGVIALVGVAKRGLNAGKGR